MISVAQTIFDSDGIRRIDLKFYFKWKGKRGKKEKKFTRIIEILNKEQIFYSR